MQHCVKSIQKYGVSSGPYFPAFGLNTERYGKIRTRKNSVSGNFSRSAKNKDLIRTQITLIHLQPRYTCSKSMMKAPEQCLNITLNITQPTFTCSKLTMETLEQCVKLVQN